MSVFDGKCQYDNKVHCALNLGCERCEHNPTYIHEQKKKAGIVVGPVKKIDYLRRDIATMKDEPELKIKSRNEKTQERKEAVLNMREQGISAPKIAAILGCKESQVYYIIEKYDLKRKPPRRTKEKVASDLAKIIELSNQGLNTYRIAEEIGTSQSLVWKELQKHKQSMKGEK